ELTVKQIAERHGVSQSSVNKWAREAGHTRRAREEQRLAALKPHILHAYTPPRTRSVSSPSASTSTRAPCTATSSRPASARSTDHAATAPSGDAGSLTAARGT